MAETEGEQESEPQVQQYDEQAAAQQAGSSLPVKEGAVFGAIAVIATYLTHLFLTIVSTSQITPEAYLDEGSVVVTDLVASWTAAGWSYLATFGVEFEADGERATVGAAENHAAAFHDTPFIFADLLLFVVSIGAILAAGYAVAKYTDAADAVEAAKAGVTIVPAFLAFAVLAAAVMTHTFEDPEVVVSVIESVPDIDGESYVNDDGEVTGDVEFGASTSSAAIYAGVLFPAVFGAVGGVLAQWRDALDRVLAKVA